MWDLIYWVFHTSESQFVARMGSDGDLGEWRRWHETANSSVASELTSNKPSLLYNQTEDRVYKLITLITVFWSFLLTFWKWISIYVDTLCQQFEYSQIKCFGYFLKKMYSLIGLGTNSNLDMTFEEFKVYAILHHLSLYSCLTYNISAWFITNNYASTFSYFQNVPKVDSCVWLFIFYLSPFSNSIAITLKYISQKNQYIYIFN